MPNVKGLSLIRDRLGGDITDIAPTILELLGIPKPDVMTGRSLILP